MMFIYVYFFFFIVKKSYYKLAKLYHPDRVALDEREQAKEKFNIIHTAYSILTDASKKKCTTMDRT